MLCYVFNLFLCNIEVCPVADTFCTFGTNTRNFDNVPVRFIKNCLNAPEK